MIVERDWIGRDWLETRWKERQPSVFVSLNYAQSHLNLRRDLGGQLYWKCVFGMVEMCVCVVLVCGFVLWCV